MAITYERLDYGSADGCQIGGAATDAVGFYGAVPVVQPSLALTTTSISALSTSSVCAMSTTQLQTLQTTVNNLVINFQALGLSA